MRFQLANKLFRWTKHIFGNFCRIFYIAYLRGGGVAIGSDCMISLGAKIDVRRGKVLIGNHCVLTHGCVILSHDHAASRMGKTSEGITTIGNHVFIGVNAVILPGISIGDHAIVGAGAVVTQDIPPYSLVVGNPASIIEQEITTKPADKG